MQANKMPNRSRKTGSASCPLCGSASAAYTVIDDVDFYECRACDFIFAEPELLRLMDAGQPVRRYNEDYWNSELAAAKQRSYGSSLARVAEALLYCQIPVNRFIDIGSGPGFLLDALAAYLPSHRERFYGVEKFPPDAEDHTKHENYLRGDLREMDMRFECGVCIEVIEHLTPAMAANLAGAMAVASVPGSLFLFNTGLTEFVRREDPGYLDPYGRGHITCWSVTSARKIFEKEGFAVYPLPGKTWAFLVERAPFHAARQATIRDRIWTALDENKRLLTDPQMGDVMYILGLESARAY